MSELAQRIRALENSNRFRKQELVFYKPAEPLYLIARHSIFGHPDGNTKVKENLAGLWDEIAHKHYEPIPINERPLPIVDDTPKGIQARLEYATQAVKRFGYELKQEYVDGLKQRLAGGSNE